jgi:AcrR family transcriptional regulator
MPRQRQAAADDAGTGALWFSPPDSEQNRRRALTRDRVVAEALAIISAGGASALSMRVLATRLGVVPAALYHHVTSKEQLYDLILDGVLAEVECQADPALPWTGQVSALAHRLRTVLEDHPGIAALLKTRDPLSPASLALAEAFLAPLHAAGLPGRQAAWAFRLIYDYTLGFALSDPTSPGEQRVQDTATRAELHAFLRSLPASRFPALAALGPYAWADDRDQRFTASLDTLIAGLQAAHHREGSSAPPGPQPRGLPVAGCEKGNDLADGRLPGAWLGYRQVSLDLVAVAAPVLPRDHVAGLGQVGDDAVRSALGDAQAGRDVAQSRARVVGDVQQDPGVVGQETPLRHTDECTVIS